MVAGKKPVAWRPCAPHGGKGRRKKSSGAQIRVLGTYDSGSHSPAGHRSMDGSPCGRNAWYAVKESLSRHCSRRSDRRTDCNDSNIRSKRADLIVSTLFVYDGCAIGTLPMRGERPTGTLPMHGEPPTSTLCKIFRRNPQTVEIKFKIRKKLVSIGCRALFFCKKQRFLPLNSRVPLTLWNFFLTTILFMRVPAIGRKKMNNLPCQMIQQTPFKNPPNQRNKK